MPWSGIVKCEQLDDRTGHLAVLLGHLISISSFSLQHVLLGRVVIIISLGSLPSLLHINLQHFSRECLGITIETNEAEVSYERTFAEQRERSSTD